MYGDIEYCSIIKNKTTGESKGLGYVRYLKPSQAARAIEECDRSKNLINSLEFFMINVYHGQYTFNFYVCLQVNNLWCRHILGQKFCSK